MAVLTSGSETIVRYSRLLIAFYYCLIVMYGILSVLLAKKMIAERKGMRLTSPEAARA